MSSYSWKPVVIFTFWMVGLQFLVKVLCYWNHIFLRHSWNNLVWFCESIWSFSSLMPKSLFITLLFCIHMIKKLFEFFWCCYRKFRIQVLDKKLGKASQNFLTWDSNMIGAFYLLKIIENTLWMLCKNI